MRTTFTLTFAALLAGGSIHAARLTNGLEIRLADGWTATARNETTVMLAPPDQGRAPGGGLFETYGLLNLPAVANMQEPDPVSELQKRYVPAGYEVRSADEVQTFRSPAGTGYRYGWNLVRGGTPMRLEIHSVGFRTLGGAMLISMGMPHLVERRSRDIAAMVSSLSNPLDAAARPNLADQLNQRLRGHRLVLFSGIPNPDGPGFADGSKTLSLRADGSYEYGRVGSIPAPADGKRNLGAGRWRIYQEAGSVQLELVSSYNILEKFTLTTYDDKILLNGRPWVVGD